MRTKAKAKRDVYLAGIRACGESYHVYVRHRLKYEGEPSACCRDGSYVYIDSRVSRKQAVYCIAGFVVMCWMRNHLGTDEYGWWADSAEKRVGDRKMKLRIVRRKIVDGDRDYNCAYDFIDNTIDVVAVDLTTAVQNGASAMDGAWRAWRRRFVGAALKAAWEAAQAPEQLDAAEVASHAADFDRAMKNILDGAPLKENQPPVSDPTKRGDAAADSSDAV